MITDRFKMNGDLWRVRFVDARNPMLVDRTGTLTVATTDPQSLTVFLSQQLIQKNERKTPQIVQPDLMTVFIHELGHCALYSFGFLDMIHECVLPEYWIKMEEFICNFLADFGFGIFRIAYSTLGYNAWKVIPGEFERIIAA